AAPPASPPPLLDALPIWRSSSRRASFVPRPRRPSRVNLPRAGWCRTPMACHTNGRSPTAILVLAATTRVLTANRGLGGLRVLTRSEEHTSELQSRENLVC